MAKPTTRKELVQYCKRQLGAPVLEINVDDDQIDDLVDDTFQYFNERHFDGVEKMYMKYKLTEEDINRGKAKDTDGVGRIFIENGGTGEWRTIESKISLLKLLAFLSRRSKVESELLDILEKIKPILLSMWADKAGSDVPIVQQRKAGQSLMPPIFFPVKRPISGSRPAV